MLVSNKDVFSIMYLAINARRIVPRGDINLALREGQGHPSRGVHGSKQDICDGIPDFVT